MPRRPKSGPPYTDIPKEIYVVVTNPWGMERNPRLRGQKDFDNVASWALLVLQQAGLGGGRKTAIECIYSMGTRDEIILQFQEGTDIIPLLGEHRWANIAKHWTGHPNDPRSTCVFIYNWRNNGDPANHNWTDNFPRSLSLDSVPAKSPYPAPSWISPPSTLSNFVHPIPHPPIPPPIPPPMPDHAHHYGQEEQPATLLPPSTVTPSPAPAEQDNQPDSREQSVGQDLASTSLFKPYEPPSQHPSHAQYLHRQQTRPDEAPGSRTSSSPPKFIKKLDPYELDEDALNILRAPNPDQGDTKDAGNEDIKPSLSFSVKAEVLDIKTEDGSVQPSIVPGSDSGYQPSQALLDAFNSLHQPEQIPSSARSSSCDPRRRPNIGPETAPTASLGYRASAELEAEINALLLGTTATAPPPSGSDARPTYSTHVAGIKREYDEDVATSLVEERKKIKVEEY